MTQNIRLALATALFSTLSVAAAPLYAADTEDEAMRRDFVLMRESLCAVSLIRGLARVLRGRQNTLWPIGH